MSEFLLTQVINYGTPLLGIVLFAGGLGLPLPCTLLVIAAGAFVRQDILPWHTTALVSILGVVAGDSISYSAGYFARELVLKRFSGTPRWIQAEKSFEKWGFLSIFFSRFLVTAIALPVNLLSGTTRFPFKRFILSDVLGEIVWIFGYGGLGYWFSSDWELVNEFLGNFGGLVLGVVFFGFGIRMAWNWREKKRLAAESEAA